MSSVTVKFKTGENASTSEETDNRLYISLEIFRDGKMKSFNFNRLLTEKLSITLERMRLNLSKKLTKTPKQKKVKSEAESSTKSHERSEEKRGGDSDIVLELLHNGNPVDLSTLNQDAWVDGAILRIDNEELPLIVNAPSVKLDNLPAIIMTGFPVFACAEFEFVEKDKCDFCWKIIDKQELTKIRTAIKTGEVIDLSDTINTNCYTCSDSDEGCFILLACTPKRGDIVGRQQVVLSKAEVIPGPKFCPFEKRHELTQILSTTSSFRVMCYNLLAEMYADSVAARTELFVHCPSKMLDMDYRRNLLLKEMLGYKADILCLQEVDKSLYKHHLIHVFSALGYTGLFRPKVGQVGEGCATFVRDSKFKIKNKLDITLSEHLSTHPDCTDIWAAVCKKEQLKLKIEERSNILQVTIIESMDNPGQLFCVANTHLYFHPTADNIRLIHMATALRYLQSVIQAYEQQGSSISLVLCGDFNSDPPSGAYQLAAAQFVPSDFVSWDSAGPEEKVEGLTLHHSMNIESACGTPDYTSYTPHFVATLDYIFIDSDKLKVESQVPLPDHSDVIADGGLPSPVFPSDHLALVCDLKLKD